jgi:hypothetical protein
VHVGLVLRERNRRDADVVAALEEQRRPGAPGIGDAIAVRCAADETAANNRNLLLGLEQVEGRLDDLKVEPEPARQLRAGQLA